MSFKNRLVNLSANSGRDGKDFTGPWRRRRLLIVNSEIAMNMYSAVSEEAPQTLTPL